MKGKYSFLCKNSKLSEIGSLLSHFHNKLLTKLMSIPVVKSKQNQILLFSVELQSLRKYLIQYYNSISHTFNGFAKEKLDSYFDNLNSISQIKIKDRDLNITGITRDSQKFEASYKHSEEEKAHKYQEGQSIKEFYRGNLELKSDEATDTSSEAQLNQFWNTFIDWEHECVDLNKAPFTLMEETPIAKIHFLFTMLGISQLLVINEGFLVGIITKKEFLKRQGANEIQ